LLPFGLVPLGLGAVSPFGPVFDFTWSGLLGVLLLVFGVLFVLLVVLVDGRLMSKTINTASRMIQATTIMVRNVCRLAIMHE
jgi:hypothetical protein